MGAPSGHISKHYVNPPIMEAAVHFHFGDAVSRQRLESLITEKVTRFSSVAEERQEVTISAEVGNSSIATSAKRQHAASFFRSEDNRRRVGCADGLLSVHALRPYPGWEVLSGDVDCVSSALGEAMGEEKFHSFGLRYLDNIVLSDDPGQLSDYFTILPTRPDGMPARLRTFHNMTESVDDDGTRAILTFLSGNPTDDGHPTVVFDLRLLRLKHDGWRLVDSDWRETLEQLHIRQREIFEASITDKTRGLFQ